MNTDTRVVLDDQGTTSSLSGGLAIRNPARGPAIPDHRAAIRSRVNPQPRHFAFRSNGLDRIDRRARPGGSAAASVTIARTSTTGPSVGASNGLTPNSAAWTHASRRTSAQVRRRCRPPYVQRPRQRGHDLQPRAAKRDAHAHFASARRRAGIGRLCKPNEDSAIAAAANIASMARAQAELVNAPAIDRVDRSPGKMARLGPKRCTIAPVFSNVREGWLFCGSVVLPARDACAAMSVMRRFWCAQPRRRCPKAEVRHNETSWSATEQSQTERTRGAARKTGRNDADRSAPEPVNRSLDHVIGVRIPASQPISHSTSAICWRS